MTVYLIGTITIDDREEYAKYEAGFIEPFQKYKGRALGVSEDPTVVEGAWPCTRTVLIEFPDREHAMGWYESPEYQAIIGHRHAASTADIVLIDAFDARLGQS